MICLDDRLDDRSAECAGAHELCVRSLAPWVSNLLPGGDGGAVWKRRRESRSLDREARSILPYFMVWGAVVVT